jgi:hypothetical protein
MYFCRPVIIAACMSTVFSSVKHFGLVKKETGKGSTEDVTLSIMTNDNVIKNPKLLAHSFNTDFLTIIEKMNNDTTTLMTEDTTKYFTEVIPENFSKYKHYFHNSKLN